MTDRMIPNEAFELLKKRLPYVIEDTFINGQVAVYMSMTTKGKVLTNESFLAIQSVMAKSGFSFVSIEYSEIKERLLLTYFFGAI